MMSRKFSKPRTCDKNFAAGTNASSHHPRPRRTATYKAILCALGLGTIAAEASEVIKLAELGTGGFRIDGIDADDFSGSSVSGAGDVNGDGLDDVIVGAFAADGGDVTDSGESYLVFGKADGASVDLAVLGAGGFRIDGADADSFSGRSVSDAGDVNGDGLADLIIGEWAITGEAGAGTSYVVFGKANSDPVDLANLGDGGFRVDGINAADFSGFSVSGAGDVNGDGLDDLVIGAYGADPGGDIDAGEIYVVFGKADGADIDLASLGAGGFRIDGIDSGDFSGRSVSGAGDVNGDGLADIVIGASGGNPGGESDAGESYVVFGKVDGSSVDLGNLGEGGFRIDGVDSGDFSGRSVSGAGDVNGDGLADIIVGAYAADPGGKNLAGESYVVFGKADSASVDLAHLGDGGFRIDGIDAGDRSGFSVSGAGDVNGDGLDDVIVGAFAADGGDITDSGESYLVFGKADSAAVDLAGLGAGGFRIDGIDADDRSGGSVSGAGDVNGDGLDDLIIGASAADPGGKSAAGESYVVFSPLRTADPKFFTDLDQFLSATGAQSATTSYAPTNSSSGFPSTFQSGDIVFSTPPGSSLFFGTWSADFPADNDIELAINGNENLDIALAEGRTYAMGVDFNDAAGSSAPSTFDVAVFVGNTRLYSFQFDTGQLPDQNYIGVWSQVPFNRLEIRETTTVNENEFFGTVSTGRRPLPNQIFADRFKTSDDGP